MSQDGFLNPVEISGEIPPYVHCCTPKATSRPASAGSSDSAMGPSSPVEALPVRSTDLLDPFGNVSSFERRNTELLQETSSSRYDYDIKNKERMCITNSLSDSHDTSNFELLKQDDGPEREVGNASERLVHALDIKANGLSDRSPYRSLLPKLKEIKCAIFEIFANRSTIEILIDHHLKTSVLTHLTKLNFSSLTNQVLKRVPRSHVINQVITDHLQEPMCKNGRNGKGVGGVMSSDQAGAPSNPSAMCLDNELLDAGSDSGYASSLAASTKTSASRSEESVLVSSYLLGRVLQEFKDRSVCQTRKKWPEDHLGQLTNNDADIDLRACSRGFSHVREASYSTSRGARHSPARSLDWRAVSKGEMLFAMSADSDDLLEDWEANLDPELIR